MLISFGGFLDSSIKVLATRLNVSAAHFWPLYSGRSLRRSPSSVRMYHAIALPPPRSAIVRTSSLFASLRSTSLVVFGNATSKPATRQVLPISSNSVINSSGVFSANLLLQLCGDCPEVYQQRCGLLNRGAPPVPRRARVSAGRGLVGGRFAIACSELAFI